MGAASSSAFRLTRRVARLLCALGMPACGASTSTPPSPSPPPPVFAASDCTGELVEIARFPGTTQFFSLGASPGGELAIAGDTLYSASSPSQFSPNTSQDIVAVANTGGAPRAVASGWWVDHFWVQDTTLFAQQGTAVALLPITAMGVAPIPTITPDGLSPYYSSDASFAYSAVVGDSGGYEALQVNRAPLAGGPPSTLFQDSSNDYECLGGMTDIGDALLVLATYAPYSQNYVPMAGHLLQVPKDGSPISEVRPDVVWGTCSLSGSWISWNGTAVIAPAVVDGALVMASVPLDGGAPTPLEGGLFGAEYVQNGGETISAFQVENDAVQPGVAFSPVYVDIVDGSTERFVCGEELADGIVGVATSSTGTYVAYAVGTETTSPQTVIARVP
jgi:hypothetical protein